MWWDLSECKKGKREFTTQELPSNDTNAKCNTDDEEEECEDNYINPEDDLFNDTEDVLDQIPIQKENLKLKCLEANDFVITSLKNGTKFSYFVVKINKVVNKNNIEINYLKQNYDPPELFQATQASPSRNLPSSLQQSLEVPAYFCRK